MGRRVGVLGGTFDPIHYGHLNAAAQAAIELELERVIFLPAGAPWQKSGQVVATAEDRLNMVLLATVDDDRFEVSRAEIDRSGPTYTVDTLSALATDPGYGGAELFFITGSDALAGLAGWREPERLLSLATFVGVTRPGHEVAAEVSQQPGIRLLEVPGVDVSSSLIRHRIAAGQPVDYLLPPAVIAYLRKRGLYQGIPV